MEAILTALGKLATLGAEAGSAAAERRAALVAEAEAAWRAYRAGLEGFWAGLKRDDAEMEELARPAARPADVVAEIRGAAPVGVTPPGGTGRVP